MAKKTDGRAKLDSALTSSPSELTGLFIFGAGEAYLRTLYRDKLAEAVLGGDDDFNYIIITGENCTPELVAENVDNLPVFGERKFVNLRDFNCSSLSDSDEKAYTELLNSLPDYVCLLIELSAKSSAKDSDGDGETASSKSKFAKSLQKLGTYIEFTTPQPNELASFVMETAREQGKKISVQNAAYLVSISSGRDMQAISTEVKKLATGVRGAEINRSDIDANILSSPELIVFELTDAVTSGNSGEALTLFRRLISRGESVYGINSLILSNIKTLYAVKLASGLSYSEMAQTLGMSDKRAAFLSRKTSHTDISKLRQALISCAETEYAFKSTGIDPNIREEMLIMKLCLLLGGI